VKGSTDALLEKTRQIVERRLGLRLEDGRQLDLAAWIGSTTGGSSLEERLARLDAADFDRDEIRRLAELLTVSETFFFRNPPDFDALEQVALPELAASGWTGLRILSAGCASGEEAYSLAIHLQGLREAARGPTPCVLGIDVNPRLLRKAAEGRYTMWSLRATSQARRLQYFRREGSDLLLDPRIRALASFEERNLVEEEAAFWQPSAFHVIFCRNVLMYFTEQAARDTVRRLARSLVPGGFLFLGHAESLRGLTTAFDVVQHRGTFFYRRREEPCPSLPDPVAPADARAPRLPREAAWPAPSSEKWFEAIESASRRIGVLSRAANSRPLESGHAAVGADVEPRTALGQALQEVQHERFHEALLLLRRLPSELRESKDARLVEALVLLNTGTIAKAEEVLEPLLASDPSNPAAYYLAALCTEQRGDIRAALENHRTAISLDPTFSMPHLHLGRLAKRDGDMAMAREELRQALHLLPRDGEERILLYGGGLGRATLLDFCRFELGGLGEG